MFATPAATGLDVAWHHVHEFHREFSLPTASVPSQISPSRMAARVSWLREELEELDNAEALVDQIDALTDLLYLTLGTFVELGVKPGFAFDLVDSANRRKRWSDGAIKLTLDGKVLKPPGWESPEEGIRLALRHQQRHDR